MVVEKERCIKVNCNPGCSTKCSATSYLPSTPFKTNCDDAHWPKDETSLISWSFGGIPNFCGTWRSFEMTKAFLQRLRTGFVSTKIQNFDICVLEMNI